MLNRIYTHLDPLLRPTYSTSGFSNFRRILAECKKGNKAATVVFVDFSKAFYSINREALFHILGLYGVPKPKIAAIRLMYDSSFFRVQTNDGLTAFFRTLVGVLQGDSLGPFLLMIVLDYVLRNSFSAEDGLTIIPRQGRRVAGVMVTDLDFADDTALIANTTQQAEELLHDLEHIAKPVGLSSLGEC